MLVLGIDPGSQRTGWGVIEQKGNELVLLDAGVIRPGSGLALEKKLAHLQRELAELLSRFEPGMVGMETVFHGPNTRSLVTLGQARGALMATVGARDVTLVELTPGEVKKAVTGRGGATKEQVEHMVGVLLGPALRACLGDRRQLDATDALAVAIATLHREALSSLGA